MENQIPPETSRPDKLYFKIGEVTEITELAAYVLRFWESEFNIISPKRTESGQRLYRKVDVESILKIKYLLYEKKFTIEGAKKNLKNNNKQKPGPVPHTSFEEIKSELLQIRAMLD
ncbi:MAG: MerR family transcriptional regulator [Desulfobacteraceae bacterium]|jgi:DNA-binding transcriptional MerR regulator|nr:MerR family transcriptional regulator [Desulfobacteraceae bacterium]